MLRKREPYKRKTPAQFKCREINEIYRQIEQVGSGTYGRVFKAYHKDDPTQIVALKKIETHREVQGFPITALREISHLKKLKHPHVVELKEVVTSRPQPPSKRGSTFLVFEYLEHDLMGLIARKIKFSVAQIKCIMKQMLEGLAYIHSKNIIHRDLKTANILLNNKGETKICDFGLSRLPKPRSKPLTVRVMTLLYRAPEVLLGKKDYSEKADIWSLGCIFAELYIGEVFFLAQNPVHLMDLIVQRVGTPEDPDYWPELDSLPYYKDVFPKRQYKANLRNYLYRKKASIDPAGLDLLEKLLEFNPEKRFSCIQALNHPYFKTEPLPCESKDMPKIEKECHEFNIRQEILKRKKKKQNELKRSGAAYRGVGPAGGPGSRFSRAGIAVFGKKKSNFNKYAPPGFRSNNGGGGAQGRFNGFGNGPRGNRFGGGRARFPGTGFGNGGGGGKAPNGFNKISNFLNKR